MEFKKAIAIATAILTIAINGCGSQPLPEDNGSVAAPAPQLKNTTEPKPAAPTVPETTRVPGTEQTDPKPAHIDSILLDADFGCMNCQPESARWETAKQVKDNILKGLDRLINNLGQDLNYSPETIRFNLNADDSNWTFNGRLTINIDGDLLQGDGFWAVQRALALTTEAWAVWRLHPYDFFNEIMPLAEAASMLTLTDTDQTCQYFAGIENGPNALISSLCQTNSLSADKVWSLTKEMAKLTTQQDQELDGHEYLDLYRKHFSAAADQAITASGLGLY